MLISKKTEMLKAKKLKLGPGYFAAGRFPFQGPRQAAARGRSAKLFAKGHPRRPVYARLNHQTKAEI
jgi:hypothetical protein